MFLCFEKICNKITTPSGNDQTQFPREIAPPFDHKERLGYSDDRE